MRARTALYLDHNAATAVDPRVLERFLAVESDCPGNPAAAHDPGRRARAAVESARAAIAAALGRAVDDVVFTSGGTESNNMAVRGLGRRPLPVLHAAVEHASVREPARRRGVLHWQVDAEGRAKIVTPEADAGLIALVHGQSEVGTVQDVVAAAAIATKIRVPLHVDAAQTLGRVDLQPVFAHADSIALSPHKAGGLRGVGVLVVRNAAAALEPLAFGGGQEHGLRPGTVSPAMAAAAAMAIELAIAERPRRAAAMAGARAAFLAALQVSAARCRVLTPLECSLPNTLLLLVPDVDGRSLLPALDLDGIAVSQGSACSSGAPTPPPVLAAMGLDEAAARACVRISFGAGDDAASGSTAGARFAAVIARLQKKT